ncbi:hypothetical protein Tanf_08880, partial [Tannerella forsythia]
DASTALANSLTQGSRGGQKGLSDGPWEEGGGCAAVRGRSGGMQPDLLQFVGDGVLGRSGLDQEVLRWFALSPVGPGDAGHLGVVAVASLHQTLRSPLSSSPWGLTPVGSSSLMSSAKDFRLPLCGVAEARMRASVLGARVRARRLF